MEKLVIFGGAFDPIHNAHLLIAQDVYEKLHSQILIFQPALLPPHKKVFAPFHDRVKMVELAIANDERFKCSDVEQRLPKPSYTIDVLRAIREENPDKKIYFIIGLDSAVDFHTWKEPDRILKEFNIAVVPRPFFKKSDVKPQWRKHMKFIDTREIEISSTEVRNRLKRGKTVKYLIPDDVIKYIQAKGLYR